MLFQKQQMQNKEVQYSMKKYTKPSVKVVNLKSSNDIAASFNNIRDQYVKNYLINGASNSYTVSVYSNTISSGEGSEVLNPPVEG